MLRRVCSPHSLFINHSRLSMEKKKNIFNSSRSCGQSCRRNNRVVLLWRSRAGPYERREIPFTEVGRCHGAKTNEPKCVLNPSYGCESCVQGAACKCVPRVRRVCGVLDADDSPLKINHSDGSRAKTTAAPATPPPGLACSVCGPRFPPSFFSILSAYGSRVTSRRVKRKHEIKPRRYRKRHHPSLSASP